MPNPEPVFVALEGLRGSGKSTIAPLLADLLGAEQVPTVPAKFKEAREYLDRQSRDPDARAYLFVSALLVTAHQVEALMKAGTSVVIDSFSQRTVATHRAFGALSGFVVPERLPVPITFHLTCDPAERAARVANRNKATTWWDELADELADQIEAEYSKFPAHRITTTGQRPEESAAAIAALVAQ